MRVKPVCTQNEMKVESSLLFQRFAQINDLSSPDGVNLGLDVTRLLVEAHGEVRARWGMAALYISLFR